MSHVDDGELTAYADGAYPAEHEDAQRIAAHLSQCADCRNRLTQNEQLRGRATAILGFATPSSTSAPAFETLQRQVTPRRTRSTLPLQWAATIVLAAGMGWLGRGMWQYEPPVRAVPAMSAQAPVPEMQPVTTDAALPATVGPQIAERRSSGAQRNQVARESEATAVEENLTVAADAIETPRPTADMATAAAPPPAALLGASHLAIAGLAVKSLRTIGDTTVVEQALPDGNIIRLAITEPRTEMAEAAKTVTANAPIRQRAAGATTGQAAAPTNDVVVRIGTRIVRLRGDVTQDSLRALAEKIR